MILQVSKHHVDPPFQVSSLKRTANALETGRTPKGKNRPPTPNHQFSEARCYFRKGFKFGFYINTVQTFSWLFTVSPLSRTFSPQRGVFSTWRIIPVRQWLVTLIDKPFRRGTALLRGLTITMAIPVVPGQAGGGSFQKDKNYIAQKDFAYRMCARRPTSAMPKSFLCCERAFCRSMVVMFCALKWSVLMSWCLLRGQVMWWSRHLMRCNGLCCVMSRLESTPVRLCTTKYYSNTTPYYKYYSVLLRTTNTTLYYSSTTLYYKVLLKYYSVLLQY